MWWHDNRAVHGRVTRWLLVATIAALLGGCFQPVYGDRSTTGGPGLQNQLRAVKVEQIEAPNGTQLSRLAVELRNALLFELDGGAGTSAPTHSLKIQISAGSQSIIVDTTTARPDIQNYAVNATYILTDLSTGKTVVNGTTFARVSFDIPGQEQRFARSRGERDAADRATKIIADNIRNRLVSYFVAGT